MPGMTRAVAIATKKRGGAPSPPVSHPPGGRRVRAKSKMKGGGVAEGYADAREACKHAGGAADGGRSGRQMWGGQLEGPLGRDGKAGMAWWGVGEPWGKAAPMGYPTTPLQSRLRLGGIPIDSYI